MNAILHLVEIGFFTLGCLCFFTLFVRLRSGKRDAARKLGLVRLENTTVYERRPTLNARRRALTQRRGWRAPAETARKYAVMRFTGDLKASGRGGFAVLVNEVIANKEKFAGAIVVVNSPGGGVAEYGQMFAEMLRMRRAGIDLTVCVDTYAASGGYLMSLPANRIVAAPFALVGSVGVVTEFPNFHKFLKNLGIEPLTFTAGTKKRNITALSDPADEEKRQALQDKLESIHAQFQALVLEYRPDTNVELLNGDSWTAQESVARNMGLVDRIATSEEFLFETNQQNELIVLDFKRSRFEGGLLRLITSAVEAGVERALARINVIN
jgi:serine protease SohB